MSRITLDAATLAKFQVGGEVVQICDESGKVVGEFRKANAPMRESFISAEERERRAAEGGRTLAEIWQSLGVK